MKPYTTWLTVLLLLLCFSCRNDASPSLTDKVSDSVQQEFNSLITQADELRALKDTNSIRYYNQAASYSRDHQYETGYAQANLSKSAAFIGLNQLDSAITSANKAIGIYGRLKDSLGLLFGYLNLSDALLRKGDLRGIVTELTEIDKLTSKYKLSEPAAVMKIYNNLASAYADMGQRDSAVAYYNTIITMGDTLTTDNAELVAGAHNGLATVYIESALFEKALAELDITNSILEEYNSNTLDILSKTNRALTYYQSGQADAALPYIREAYQMALDANLEYYMPSLSNLLVAVLIKQGKYEEALPYSRTAYDKALAHQSPNGIITSAYSLSHNYLALKRYTAAIPLADTALQLSLATGRYADLSNAYHYLSESYAGLQNFPKAFYYMKEYAVIEDSLRAQNNAQAVAKIEDQYYQERNQKVLLQKELLLTQKDSQLKRKNLWISVISLGGILFLALLYGTIRNIRSKNRLQQKEMNILEKDKELDIVKAKLVGIEDERNRISKDLHDGVVVQFSAVKMNLSMLAESHSSLMDAADYKQIIKRLDEATAELRKTAHNLMPGTLLKTGLSEAVYYFCKDIEQSSALTINVQQFNDIPRILPEVELSIFRILQETLQNILKHAHAKQVFVQLSCNDLLLNITIEDDGIHWNDQYLSQSRKGVGLKNIRERIDNLKGTWDISSSETGGNSVYIEIDLLHYLRKK